MGEPGLLVGCVLWVSGAEGSVLDVFGRMYDLNDTVATSVDSMGFESTDNSARTGVS